MDMSLTCHGLHYDETEKRAHDSQKKKLKLSHVWPSYSQASGTNQPTKV